MHVSLTKHEALPAKVRILDRIGDLLMKLDGVWRFTKIECRQVGDWVMPSIPLPQGRVVVAVWLVARRFTGNVMFVDKIHDIVGRLRLLGRRRLRVYFGLRLGLRLRRITRRRCSWVTPLLPVWWAFIPGWWKHLQLEL